MIKNVLRVGAVVLVLGLASGCASTASVEAAQAAADAAARDAAAAKSSAEAALATADAAAMAAAGAQTTADEALVIAAEAIVCCEANREALKSLSRKTSLRQRHDTARIEPAGEKGAHWHVGNELTLDRASQVLAHLNDSIARWPVDEFLVVR